MYKVVHDTTGAGRKTRVQRYGVGVPHHFFCYEDCMKEISIFIDESGDFGKFNKKSPFYIVTMVFHDQSSDITACLASLEQEVLYLTLHFIAQSRQRLVNIIRKSPRISIYIRKIWKKANHTSKSGRSIKTSLIKRYHV